MKRSRLHRLAVAIMLACGCSTEEPVESRTQYAEGPPSTDKRDIPDTRLDEDAVLALEALGYVEASTTSNPLEQGVTARSGSAQGGVNVFSSRRRASANLVDMSGEAIHQWASDSGGSWMHVEPVLDGSGSLLVIVRDVSLKRVSWESEVEWATALRAHHDLAVHEDGRIFLLVRRRTTLQYRQQPLPVLADGVAILSSRGELLQTVDLLPLLRDQVADDRLRRVSRRVSNGDATGLLRPGGLGDVLHANSIEFLHREIPRVAEEGDILISFRAISQVAILDPDFQEVRWISNVDGFDGQHDATQLENGHLMVFDNGIRRGWSRVVEFRPHIDGDEEQVIWTFRKPGFFSRLRGGAQALPNGNVLITESDQGHVFEVTRSRDTAWEYWNPDVRPGGDEAQRGSIYRFNRFDAGHFPL